MEISNFWVCQSRSLGQTCSSDSSSGPFEVVAVRCICNRHALWHNRLQNRQSWSLRPSRDSHRSYSTVDGLSTSHVWSPVVWCIRTGKVCPSLELDILLFERFKEKWSDLANHQPMNAIDVCVWQIEEVHYWTLSTWPSSRWLSRISPTRGIHGWIEQFGSSLQAWCPSQSVLDGKGNILDEDWIALWWKRIGYPVDGPWITGHPTI